MPFSLCMAWPLGPHIFQNKYIMYRLSLQPDLLIIKLTLSNRFLPEFRLIDQLHQQWRALLFLPCLPNIIGIHTKNEQYFFYPTVWREKEKKSGRKIATVAFFSLATMLFRLAFGFRLRFTFITTFSRTIFSFCWELLEPPCMKSVDERVCEKERERVWERCMYQKYVYDVYLHEFDYLHHIFSV